MKIRKLIIQALLQTGNSGVKILKGSYIGRTSITALSILVQGREPVLI